MYALQSLYNIEETKKDRRIEVRMVFSNEDLEKSIKERKNLIF